MPEFVEVARTVLLALVGFAVATRLNVPAASFLGPMIFVGAAAVLGMPQPHFPSWGMLAAQIVFGSFIGCQVDEGTVARVRAMGKPVAYATAWTVLSGLGMGYLLAALTTIDTTTAFLGAIPGGLAEMLAVAISLEADAATVATFQTLRILATMSTIPILSQWMATGSLTARPQGAQARATAPSRAGGIPAEDVLLANGPAPSPSSPARRTVAWMASLAVGLAGAALFLWLHIPAPGIVGSMTTVALGRGLGVPLGKPPHLLRLVCLMVIATLTGTTFSSQTLIQLREVMLPAVVVTVATVLSGVLLARLIQRSLGLDASTALLACAPAGVSQMAVIADEMGSDVLVVALFQVTRVMCCVFIAPFFMRLII